MIRPDFPQVIDASLIAAWRSCPRKAFLEYFQHWKPTGQNVHLHAGKAFASALETARKAFFGEGRSAEVSVALGFGTLLKEYGNFECPANSPKTLEGMAGAYEYYFSEYPLETDSARPFLLPGGQISVEFSFAEPIDFTHPVTGNPILYVGRLDQIVKFAGGYYGEDDKTTSRLGSTWARQWDLRSQFTGYCWGVGKSIGALSGFLVRGVSILKNGFETQQALTYRPAWMIDRWYEQLLRDVQAMQIAWESGYFDYNLDESCNQYGGCVFKKICLSSNPEEWLKVGFERRQWDPVTRTETLLDFNEC
jgi:hypothetical protein